MAEYIFTATETDEKLFSFRNGYRERIVRCKDCKHLIGVGTDFYYCGLFRTIGEYDFELHKPTYDSFCAWGERSGDA